MLYSHRFEFLSYVKMSMELNPCINSTDIMHLKNHWNSTDNDSEAQSNLVYFTFQINRLRFVVCFSILVVRGNIFNVQERDDLNTNEINIGKTKILRDTDHVLVNDSSDNNHMSMSEIDWKGRISYHTHRHCPTSTGAGEFVFMGRLRFNEIMLMCAPRLEEWANIVYRYRDNHDEPCILLS